MTANIYGDTDCDICLIQMIDDHDTNFIQNEYNMITSKCKKTKPLLVTVKVDDWNSDLSPWESPAVFGNKPFGSGAKNTLRYITDILLPEIKKTYLCRRENLKLVIGGYSLAGLFALWASYQTSIFSGCAAASPSVWFNGWIKYAESHTIQTNNIYLSLGKQESKTRNSLMKKVDECIIRQDELLTGKNHILEWNEGNHFTNPDLRTANGFEWVLEQILNASGKN